MSKRTSRRTKDAPPSKVRFVWPALGLLLCLAALGAAISGLFTVRQVQIVGANLPRGTITRDAGVNGANIFAVQSDAVVERLSTIPQIVVQRVQTSFPGRVTIYARERVPMVAWQPVGGGLFLLDPDGQVIEQVRATTLPVILGAANQARLGPGVVAAVRFAVQRLPRAPKGAIASFRFGPRVGLTIVGRAGWTAIAGRGDPQTLTNRIATLAALLENIHGRPLKSVDLRYRVPDAVFAAP